jgi:hypothetical protein
MVLPEVMLSLFSLLALFFHLDRKYLGYFLFASAAVLTKETGLVIIAVCAFLDVLRDSTFGIRRPLAGLSRMAGTLLPVLPWLVFLAAQYRINGWFLFPEHMGYITFDFNIAWERFTVGYLARIFTFQGRWLLFYAMALTLLWLVYKKEDVLNIWCSRSLVLFILLYAVVGSMNFYADRYILCAIPPFILLCVGLIMQLLKRKYALTIFILVFTLAQIRHIQYKTVSDYNLGYISAVKVNQSMIHYCLDNDLKDEKLTVFFIMYTLMTNPLSGYIKDNEVFTQMDGDYRDSDYYIVSNFDTNDLFLNFRKSPELVMIKRFEHGPAWIEPYKRKVNKSIL